MSCIQTHVVELYFTASDDVKCVKQAIAEKLKLKDTAYEQLLVLIYKGALLEDGHRLAEYNIKQDCKVLLYFKGKGLIAESLKPTKGNEVDGAWVTTIPACALPSIDSRPVEPL